MLFVVVYHRGFADNIYQQRLSTSFTNFPLEFFHLHFHADGVNLNHLLYPPGLHSEYIELEAFVSKCAEKLPTLSQVCFTFGHDQPYEACFSIIRSEGSSVIIRKTPEVTVRMAVARSPFRDSLW